MKKSTAKHRWFSSIGSTVLLILLCFSVPGYGLWASELYFPEFEKRRQAAARNTHTYLSTNTVTISGWFVKSALSAACGTCHNQS